MDILRKVQTLTVGAIYFFFELDLSARGLVEPLRFHCNGITQQHDDGTDTFTPMGDMEYRGQTYTFVGIDVQGIQVSNDGKVNTPTLRVMNNINGQQGAVSALCLLYDNLSGAKVTIRMTTDEAYEDKTLQEFTQFWWIERVSENNINLVSFELTSPLDFKRQRVPTRMITDLCTWAMRGEYRGETCGYTGARYFNTKGEPVDSIVLDDCGGTCNDCIIRFGEGAELPFGGYMIPNRTNY